MNPEIRLSVNRMVRCQTIVWFAATVAVLLGELGFLIAVPVAIGAIHVYGARIQLHMQPASILLCTMSVMGGAVMGYVFKMKPHILWDGLMLALSLAVAIFGWVKTRVDS